jgi:hypothetical protein
VDVRAETREARLEVRRQLRAADSSRATEENSKRRKTAKHWYRPELVAWYRLKSVFGVLLLTSPNGDFVVQLRTKVEPQNLGSSSTAHEKT